MNFWAIGISLIASFIGGQALAYYGINLVDKLVDLFRSEEAKIARLIDKGETIVIDKAGKVKKAL